MMPEDLTTDPPSFADCEVCAKPWQSCRCLAEHDAAELDQSIACALRELRAHVDRELGRIMLDVETSRKRRRAAGAT